MNTPLSVLHDRRTGLLVDVDRLPTPPGMPSCWVSYGAMVARADRFAPWRADSTGFGASLGDEAAARGAAMGEAVERYCGNAIPEDLPRASYRELRNRGHAAVDPTELALYSAEQYAQPGFPFVPFDHDLVVRWTPGIDLHDHCEVMVPASSAYLDVVHGSRADEPAVHSLMYSGIATGVTVEDAERSAVEELFERDATGIWWASGATAAGIEDHGQVIGQLGRPPLRPSLPEGRRPSADRSVGLDTGEVTEADLRYHLIWIPSEAAVPVVAVLIEDLDQQIIGFGSACRSTPFAAASKALVEALGVLRLGRDLDDPGSSVWQAVAAGQVEDHVYLAHRPDRRYLDDLDPRWRRLTDLPPVAQLYLDPRMQTRLDRLRPRERVSLADLPAIAAGGEREEYLRRIEAMGLRAYRVDLTTPDAAAAGLRVVRVIVPGLVGNGPPAFPLRGGTRWSRVPHRSQWREAATGRVFHRPLRHADLVTDPLPLA